MTFTDIDHHRFTASARRHLREAGVPVDGRRVDLSTDKTIDAGADRRGYRFVAVHAEAGLRIVAGCHSFTLREARPPLDHDARTRRRSRRGNCGACRSHRNRGAGAWVGGPSKVLGNRPALG